MPSSLPIPPRASFEPVLPADPNLLNVGDYERVAAERLAPGPLAYFTGGADDERTLADCRSAFARRRIVPRVMRDVSSVEHSVDVLGRRWSWPLFLCPTALNRMAHPDGELAVARAAAERGITTLSTSASTDLAGRWPQWAGRVVPGLPGWPIGRRAPRPGRSAPCSNGYEALVLHRRTVPRLGRRGARDLRVGFTIPRAASFPTWGLAAGVAPAEGCIGHLPRTA